MYLNIGKLSTMREINKKAFGKRVRERMDKVGITQGALGAVVGVKQQTIYNVCAGLVKRPSFIDELAVALGTTKAWLFYGEGEEVVVPIDQREKAHGLLDGAPDEHVGAVIELLQTLNAVKRRSA